MGDLTHNAEMSVMAQAWADKLATLRVLKHSGDKFNGQPLGENVASKWSSTGADYAGKDLINPLRGA